MKILAKFLNSETSIVVLLLVFLMILNIAGLLHKGLTYDEGRHYDYGRQIFAGKADRFDDSKMPFSAWNALPAKIFDLMKSCPGGHVFKTLGKKRTGRYMTIFFSLLVAIFVYRWARELYGREGGLAALLLYVFCPNMLAHSRLITTDVYCAGMILISLYFFWRYLNHGGWIAAFLSSLTLGLSQLAKYTCVFLYPIFLLIVIFFHAGHVWELFRQKNWREIMAGAIKSFSLILFFVTVSFFVINLGFLGNRTFRRLEDYHFKSQSFNKLQNGFPVLNSLRVPLPYPYLEGLDWVKYNEETGKGFGAIYLFGQLKRGAGFAGYYFYAFLYKVPIAVLLLLVLTLLAYLLHNQKFHFLKNEIFLLVPVLFFAIYFNFFYAAQIGMRYFLVVLPLLYVWCGSLFVEWKTFKRQTKAFYGLLLVYVMVSVLSYTPHYLAYFNELVGDRKQAYKILADSNIDWGENEWFLKRYQKKHPEIIMSPEVPSTGRIVVGVNDLVGVTINPKKFEWLRRNFEPVDHIAYSYLVYDINPEDLQRI